MLDIGITITQVGTKEGIFFMYDVCALNFKILRLFQSEVIHYAAKASDSFSIVTDQVKPFNSDPPHCKHDDILQDIQGDLLSQTIGAKNGQGPRHLLSTRS